MEIIIMHSVYGQNGKDAGEWKNREKSVKHWCQINHFEHRSNKYGGNWISNKYFLHIRVKYANQLILFSRDCIQMSHIIAC